MRRIPAPSRPSLSLAVLSAAILLVPGAAGAQDAAGGQDAAADPHFHTFSIAAVDPATGESGVAVTTRVTCVGNVVPWVRAGVGAVATQSWTRVEYGTELLDLLEEGVSAEEALRRSTDADDGRERRQVAVIDLEGRGAQFTGSEAMDWAGERSGPNHVTQGNLLVGPGVLDAVARTFEASEGSGRHLADRLVEALEAGQAEGGDARTGRLQSASLIVADPRGGTRPDGVTTHLNVCEHPEPVAELRRQHDAVAGLLGYRNLEQLAGSDVAQLKIILHALGYFRPETAELPRDGEWNVYTSETVEAVDAFRANRGLSTPQVGSPRGLVDGETVGHLWAALEEEGKAREVREAIRGMTAIRR